MKRWLCGSFLLAVVLVITPAQAFTVAGHLTGQTGLAIYEIYAVPTTFDTFFVTIGIPLFGNVTYSFANMDAASYFLFAFKDLNANLLPDLDEPRGFYGGMPPQLLVLSSDTTGIDIELLLPNSGGFSGTIAYAGTSTGLTFILAHRDPSLTDSVHGIGVLINNTGNGSYTCFVDSFGTYYAESIMDLTFNLQHDADEPYGVYGGSEPSPIDVQPTDFPDNVDITLEDPNRAPEPPVEVPRVSGLSKIYPNPFNSQTRISFVLPVPGNIELSLYDILGRQVEVLSNGLFTGGEHDVVLNAHGLPSGLYLVCLKTGSGSTAQRLLLLK
jgi:hypothetical protein